MGFSYVRHKHEGQEELEDQSERMQTGVAPKPITSWA